MVAAGASPGRFVGCKTNGSKILFLHSCRNGLAGLSDDASREGFPSFTFYKKKDVRSEAGEIIIYTGMWPNFYSYPTDSACFQWPSKILAYDIATINGL